MKITCAYFISCIVLCAADSESQSFRNNISEATLSEDGRLNFTQLVIKYGQSVEQFDVVTEDGYILTVFRIPGKKPPVLLFHGITDSCDSFVIRGENSLAITLAVKGYEVWVGNNRGNLYGIRHVTMNPDEDKEFWDYSFHEIGYYDLAATIDFIRAKTGVESISTVSHSQGTSAHMALTSLRPEYNERIKVIIALAPIAFLDSLVPPVSLIAEAGPIIATILKLANIEKVWENQKTLSDLVKFLCSKGALSYIICFYGVTFPVGGFDPERLEPEFLTGVAIGHYPRATSRKTLEHYDQVFLSHRFAQYDYGLENFVKYGSSTPPEYNLTAVTTKVALFVGNSDNLSKLEDVEHLRRSLPNVVHFEVMEPKRWNHADFIWANDMNKYLFPGIFKVLEKYN